MRPQAQCRVGADGVKYSAATAEITNEITLRETSDDWSPSTYIGAVASSIAREGRCAVVFQACGLGFLTFSKFLMWRDLDSCTWPDPLPDPCPGSLPHWLAPRAPF